MYFFGGVRNFMKQTLLAHPALGSFLRGNIFPHVQFHFLVRPSFPTCAVPVLIFELSVPIFPHVQFHPNMHYPILPHVQFQQEYELATLGSCTVETPFNKQQFHKN